MAETDWCLITMAAITIATLLFCGKYAFRCFLEKKLSDREVNRLKRRYFKNPKYIAKEKRI